MKTNNALCLTVSVSLILTSCKQKGICSWYYEKINAEVLLGKEKEEEIIVGVIDSGINENFLQLFDEKTIVGGFDFIDNDNQPYSVYNLHGSFISFLIAGKDFDGLKGIDSRLKVMPVRVFDESGNTDDELVYEGIKYAIDNGCSVINMSFASSKYEPYLASLFQNTENPKFIASNGDFSANGYCYPATYEGVIRVSAIDEKGELCQYSNTATADQSIYAPGVDLPIVSVNINGDIIKTMVSGSSYATAIVSGIIGSLLLSNDLNEETLKTYDVYEDGFLNCNKLLKKA